MNKSVAILGCRGIPAQHGGFETFAEQIALYLKRKNWHVTVYCQQEGDGQSYEDEWRGIHRVHIPVSYKGPKASVIFDWKSTLHAVDRKIPTLTLGYNTAVFCILYRIRGVKNIINMDGIEWKRGKWNIIERIWFYINEKLGAWLGNHLIADHPEIKKHLSQFVSSSKITVIPYSAEALVTADETLLASFNLIKNKYALLIARPEKENSVLEIVKAYSRSKREIPLIILGNYHPDSNNYHKSVIKSAGGDVKFIGAIYDKDIVQALRFYTRLYIHGHTVGGTNPSLVEALGASSPILAHRNKFNTWVTGECAYYFSNEDECSEQLDILLGNDRLIEKMRKKSFDQIRRNSSCKDINEAYEDLLLQYAKFSLE